VVEPNGTVVLVGTYYQNQSFNKNGGRFFVTRSSNGGVSVKVDSNGRVGVLCYDLRNDVSAKDGTFTTTEWIASSTNGGQSFGTSRRVAPDFDHPAAANAGGYFLGDYQGLGVKGSKVIPFFGATLLPQADGRIGSDIFTRKIR
jgi:hypothetical protein